MDIHHVEANTYGRNQVEERVFAENLPAEHPVGTVAEPACIIEGKFYRITACIYGRDRRRRAFRNLRQHEVEVDPGHELLVLCTDIELESWIELVELAVFGGLGRLVDGGVRSVSERAVGKCNVVNVVVESREHATEISA